MASTEHVPISKVICDRGKNERGRMHRALISHRRVMADNGWGTKPLAHGRL
jgi:hypothetical protein